MADLARNCDVDGCNAVVRLTRLATDDGTSWLVKHGKMGEAQRLYTTDELLVTTGYQPWVREVHAYESQRPHAY